MTATGIHAIISCKMEDWFCMTRKHIPSPRLPFMLNGCMHLRTHPSLYLCDSMPVQHTLFVAHSGHIIYTHDSCGGVHILPAGFEARTGPDSLTTPAATSERTSVQWWYLQFISFWLDEGQISAEPKSGRYFATIFAHPHHPPLCGVGVTGCVSVQKDAKQDGSVGGGGGISPLLKQLRCCSLRWSMRMH